MQTRGVVNQIVAPSDLDRVAREIAAQIAELSPTAVQTIKEAELTLQDLPLAEAFAREAELGQRTFVSYDARKGLAAFAARAAKPAEARK